MNINEIVDSTMKRLDEANVKALSKDVTAFAEKCANDWHVPLNEIPGLAYREFCKRAGKKPTYERSSALVKIGSIAVEGNWVDLEAKVIQLWDPNSDSMAQTGLLADGSGATKFVIWKRSGLPLLEDGKSYLIKGAVTKEYQGKYSVDLVKTTKISPLEKPIEVVSSAGGNGGGKTEDVTVADIKAPGKWVNLKAKVVQLWDKESESISQVGLVGDSSGVIKFIVWQKANLPLMEEGKVYNLKNVVTDEYQGKVSIKLNSTSSIEPLSEDLDVGRQKTTFIGALVDIQKGSGLVKRCPICKRAVQRGVCQAHGKVTGTPDLRIKGILDDGIKTKNILIGRELTEKLTGLTVESAQQMVMENLDSEAAGSYAKEKLLGRYWIATGSDLGENFLVDSLEPVPPVTDAEIAEVIKDVQ
jgi:replication factor A1